MRGNKAAFKPRPKHFLDQLLGFAFPTVAAQSEYYYEAYDEIGYVMVDAWTDNDDSTWEGVIWGYVYETETDFSYAFRSDITDADEDTAPTLANNWGGSVANPYGGPYEIKDSDINRMLGHLSRASLKKEVSSRIPGVGDTLPGEAAVPFSCPCWMLTAGNNMLSNCMLQNTLGNSWKQCGASLAGCTLSGPLYPKCVALVCGSNILLSFGYEMWSFSRACM